MTGGADRSNPINVGLSPYRPILAILAVRRVASVGDQSVSEAVTLRPAVPTDASAIRELTDVYAKWVPVIGREPKPIMADYTEAVDKIHIDLLYVDGVLAALIEAIPRNRPSADRECGGVAALLGARPRPETDSSRRTDGGVAWA